MAQLVVAVAGAALGSFFGPVGTQVGFALGSYVGAQAFGAKPPAPQPADTKWTGLEYGTPVPWFVGTMRLSAIPIYLSEKEAVAQTTEAGKGGDEVTTGYEYFADCLFELADNEAAALLDVFKAGRRAWTARADATADQLDASAETEDWEEIRFYGGADDQLPDPDYEAAVGVGHAPAYLGKTTVFIRRLRLDGNGQLPQLHFVPTTHAEAGEVVAPALERLFEFNYESLGSGQFGNADFTGPLYVIGEVSNAPNTITFYRYTSPSTAPFADTVGVSGVAGGGVTPQGGIGDTEALLFNVGGTLFGYYPGLVDYTHSTANLVGVSFCYAFQGNELFICTSAGEIYRYNRATGGNELASNASAENCRTIVIVAGAVYGADPFTSGELIRWDGDTLDETGRWALAANTLGLLCTDGSDVFDFVDNAGTVAMVRFNGSTWDTVVADMGDIDQYLLGSGSVSNPVLRDGYVYLSRSTGSFDWALVRARYQRQTYTPTDVDLADVVTMLHARAGQAADQIDVTDLVGTGVHGVIAGQVQPVRQILQQLALGYYFERVESNGVARYVDRGGASVATIPFTDLGVGIDAADAEPLLIERANDLEVANEWVVRFISRRGQRFEPSAQHSSRLTTQARGVQDVTLGIVFTEAQGRGRAQSFALDAQVQRTTFTFSLGLRYAYLEPTDVITLEARSGSTYRVRLLEITEAKGVLQCRGVLDDPYALRAEGAAAGDDEAPQDIARPGDTEMVLLDIAATRDSEAQSAGHLVAATSSGEWAGASIRRSVDDADFSSEVATITERAVIGVTTTTLASDPPLNREDVFGTLGVRVLGLLSSSNRAAMQLDRTANVLAVETTAGWFEVIRFRTATLTATEGAERLYTLTSLQRGRRGTEPLVALHATGLRVVLLRANGGLRNVPTEVADLNQPRFFKGVTFGRSLSTADSVTFADTGVRLKPFAPTRLRIQTDANGTHRITWRRRTRLLARYGGSGGSSVPLGEASEAYQVEILDGATVVRAIAATDTLALYTLSQQLADFGTVPAAFDVRVFQTSGAVGRGYPLQASFTNDFVPASQSNTITIGGTFTTGVPIRVLVNGAQIASYTTDVADTDLDGVAASLAAVLDALAGYTAAAVGPVITITGPAGASYSLTTDVGGASTMSFGLLQSASPASPGTGYRAWLWINNLATGISEPIPAGVTFTVTVQNGPAGGVIGSFSYTTTAPSTQSFVLGQLEDAFDATALGANGFQFSTQFAATGGYYGQLLGPVGLVGVTVYGNASAPWSLGVSILDPGSAVVLTARPQISTVFLNGTVADGEQYIATINGVDYSYTASVPTDVIEDVIDGLVAEIDPTASYSAVKTDTYLMDVTGPVNTPFSTASRILRAITATVD